MIGHQPTGRIDGISVTSTPEGEVSILAHGESAQLAIVSGQGLIVCAGAEVAGEFVSVTLGSYRRLIQGEGFLRFFGEPLPLSSSGGPESVISAVSHEGPTVTVDGVRAQLAIVDGSGNVVAAGDAVAAEVEAVVVNNYRNFLIANEHLRVIIPACREAK